MKRLILKILNNMPRATYNVYIGDITANIDD